MCVNPARLDGNRAGGQRSLWTVKREDCCACECLSNDGVSAKEIDDLLFHQQSPVLQGNIHLKKLNIANASELL